MSVSAFGVDHGTIYKGDREREKHYGRMGNLMTGAGATTAAVGAGAGAMGIAEHKGRDPMGFTQRTAVREKMHPEKRARILRASAKAHGWQAKTLIPAGAATLALGGAYRHAQKREVASKERLTKAMDRDKAKRAALGTAGATVGGGMAYGAARFGKPLVQAGYLKGKQAHLANKAIREYKAAGNKGFGKPTLKLMREFRSEGAKVAAVKGTGGLALGGAGAAGGAGAVEVGRHTVASRKRK